VLAQGLPAPSVVAHCVTATLCRNLNAMTLTQLQTPTGLHHAAMHSVQISCAQALEQLQLSQEELHPSQVTIQQPQVH
jgi:hypothetical protein